MSADVPKATLYTFDGSVWASAPRLALVEKGYSSTDVDLKIVDLVKGENFDPSYLRINSKGTVPTLVVPLLETTSAEVATKFRAINDTKAILEFLDQSRSSNTVTDTSATPAPILAPATIEGKAASDEIIALVHSPTVDPNFLLLGARSESELASSRKALPGTFVTNRHNVLLSHQKSLLENDSATVAFDGSSNPKSSAVHENLKKWYADKLDSQSLLTKAYLENDAESVQQLIQSTNAAWKAVAETLLKLESKLQGPFALGDQISLADLHVLPWLARLSAVAGGLTGKHGLEALDEVVRTGGAGEGVGAKVKGLWEAFADRPSFKAVYGEVLH
ncbi:Glutathione S-transferase [Pseudozyma hubeiensis]|nr:Glutathione S-transferase [Pseudozyma hubeiensis]